VLNTEAAPVLLDVVQEHLDEADFLLGQWSWAARSPLFTVRQLRRTVENRLLAHLDGLLVGGKPVADEILWPACTDEGAPSFTVAAAASALLLDPGAAAGGRLIPLLSESPSASLRAGLRLAFQITARTDLDEPLRLALYATDASTAQLDLLSVLAARRIDPGPILAPLLRTGDPALLAASLTAAGAAQPGPFRHLVEDHLRHADAPVRAAALQTGMLWNLTAAWSECLREVRAGSPGAMLMAALLAERNTAGLLIPALVEETQRHAALWALGFTGFSAAVEACLPLLDDPDELTARLAAEAIGGITDLPVNDDPYVRAAVAEPPPGEGADLPPLEEDLATELEPTPAAELPLPDAARIRDWWAENRKRFDAQRRYVRGAPVSAPAFGAALRESSLRRSGPLALEVAIRGGGRFQVPALRLGHEVPEIPAEISFTREPPWR
jgi:uncharacterized protein (TIGR02270 family)